MIIPEVNYSYYYDRISKPFHHLRIEAKFPLKYKSVRMYGPYTYVKAARYGKIESVTFIPIDNSVGYKMWRLRLLKNNNKKK